MAAAERRDHQRSQRPEIRGLVPGPGQAVSVLAPRRATPPKSTPSSGWLSSSARCRHCAVQAGRGPGRLDAPWRPSARRDVLGDVEAVAVVGLDPLDAEVAGRARTWPRHHASAAGLVKSTGEPVPIHQRPTCGSPDGLADEMARRGAPSA